MLCPSPSGDCCSRIRAFAVPESPMSRVCQVTGKKPMKGHLVSHANNKTIRSFQPNLHYRRFWLESQNRARKDQARVIGRDRSLLHNNQEQAHYARQAGDQKVRSQGPQARALQGNEAEIKSPPKARRTSAGAARNPPVT